MPKVVRLPAHITDNELRVYWDHTDEGNDLHVWGPDRSTRRLGLGIFTEEGVEFNSIDDEFSARRSGITKKKPSALSVLEAMGYDPKTLVFSVRKKNEPAPSYDVPDDIRKRLEDAQTALIELGKALKKGETVKNAVVVYSEDDMRQMEEAQSAAEEAIARALDMLDSNTK